MRRSRTRPLVSLGVALFLSAGAATAAAQSTSRRPQSSGGAHEHHDRASEQQPPPDRHGGHQHDAQDTTREHEHQEHHEDQRPQQHDHEHGHEPDPSGEPSALPPWIQPPTEDERAAAFPVLHDDEHPVHGQSINSLVLFEQLEWRNADRDALAWDTKGWVGRDRDRFWLRTEGDAEDGGVQEAQLHLLYGRAIARWWDLVAGVRQDWRPGPAQTWAAIGLQGLAPYFFDIEATGYIGAGGRTHVRLEAAYDLLLTNRLIAQPLLEFEIAGKADPVRRVGVGLTVGEMSVRLRYEVRREFAPYIGLLWRRTFFGTADMARLDGRGIGGTVVSIGGRVWF